MKTKPSKTGRKRGAIYRQIRSRLKKGMKFSRGLFPELSASQFGHAMDDMEANGEVRFVRWSVAREAIYQATNIRPAELTNKHRKKK